MNGCELRTNGRTWFFRIGVPSLASGSTCALAEAILRNGGRSDASVGRSSWARRSALISVDSVWRSVPGSFDTKLEMFTSCEANASNTWFDCCTRRVSSVSLPPSSCTSSP